MIFFGELTDQLGYFILILLGEDIEWLKLAFYLFEILLIFLELVIVKVFTVYEIEIELVIIRLLILEEQDNKIKLIDLAVFEELIFLKYGCIDWIVG